MMRLLPIIITETALILLLLIYPVAAQPNLPDIAGASVRGVNLLTWTNQFGDVKSIQVLRSADSTNDFNVIGNVKDVSKGVENFTDPKPMPGNNWYELSIEFKSSVKWMSKALNLYIEGAELAIPDTAKKTVSPKQNAEIKKEKITPPATPAKTIAKDTIKKKPKPVLQLRPDTTVSDASTYFKSKYVRIDPETGHVYMELPDVKKYHYSIKFYDQKNKVVVDVPKLNASPVILDRRNFQKKGIYHFIIKKDNAEFDQGYVVVN